MFAPSGKGSEEGHPPAQCVPCHIALCYSTQRLSTRQTDNAPMPRYPQGNMKRVKGENLPRWQTTVAWLSLGCAVVTLFGLWPLAGLDLRMHLTLGRWIWAHGWVPKTDPFS